MSPEEQDQQRIYQTEMEMRAKIGPSFGHRRQPRIRVVKDRTGLFQSIGSSKSKNVCRRIAINRRDEHYETRPPRIFIRDGKWHVGYRRAK